jgi:hypothetical protein
MKVAGFYQNLSKDFKVIYEIIHLYPSRNIMRMIKSMRMRWAGYVASMEKKRNASRILVGKPEEKRQLGRPGRRCKDDIKMDIR